MRRLALAAGVIVLVAAWPSPLAGPLLAPFVRDMLAHVAVISVVAPLAGAWLAERRAAAGAPLLAPLPAAAVAFGVVWLWHVPLLHGLAHLHPLVSALELLSLLGASALLWTSVLQGARRAAGRRSVLALLMTATQLVVLGTLLTLAPYPLYLHGAATLADVYQHFSAQRLGGLTMLLGGGLPHVAAGLWLLDRLLRRPYGPVPAQGAGARARPGTRGRWHRYCRPPPVHRRDSA